jgi:hypothetical protein
MIAMATAEQELEALALNYLRPREARDIVEWCRQNIVLVDKANAFSGPWSDANCPYVREPLRAMVDAGVETVVLEWASQLFKTTLLIGFTCFIIENDPGPLLWVMNNDRMARNFNQKRFEPTIEASEVLSAFKPENPDNYDLRFEVHRGELGGQPGVGPVPVFDRGRVEQMAADHPERGGRAGFGAATDAVVSKFQTYFNEHADGAGGGDHAGIFARDARAVLRAIAVHRGIFHDDVCGAAVGPGVAAEVGELGSGEGGGDSALCVPIFGAAVRRGGAGENFAARGVAGEVAARAGGSAAAATVPEFQVERV